MKKEKPLLFLVLLLLWQAGPAYCLFLEDIPLDSWGYLSLEQLHTAGLLPRLHKNIKPYSEREIASFLADIQAKTKDGKLAPSQDQIWLIQKLIQRFQDQLGNARQEVEIKYGIDPLFYLYQQKDSTDLRFKMRLEGSVSLGRKLLLRGRTVIDNQPDRERGYYAKKWKSNLVGTMDEAYARIDLKYLEILFGREAFSWGPSPRDNLLLSGHSPPFDMLKLQTQVGSFRLIYFTTILDPFRLSEDSTAHRFLSGHRINWKTDFGLELGLSEVILYGGINRTPEPYYLNPLLPYYGEQFNRNEDDNPLWDIDFNFAFKSKELYGEFLIDDFQYDFKTEPHQIGFKLGLGLCRPFQLKRTYLNLEYARINKWVYGEYPAWNLYAYHNVGMGSFLGPDADDVFIKILHHLSRDFWVSLSARYKRKGEGRIDQPQTPAVPFPDKFPSGTVEYTKEVNLSWCYQPDSWLRLEVWLDYQNMRNYMNSGGNNKDLYEAGFLLNWTFLKEKSFNWIR